MDNLAEVSKSLLVSSALRPNERNFPDGSASYRRSREIGAPACVLRDVEISEAMLDSFNLVCHGSADAQSTNTTLPAIIALPLALSDTHAKLRE